MSGQFFEVSVHPDKWKDQDGKTNDVISITPWQKSLFSVGDVRIKGRKAWNAGEPVWANEVVYYNTKKLSLPILLNKIVVHHTNNNDSIKENEEKQKGRGYAALGYHFFIAKDGEIYQGRPLEVMGSNAGEGKTKGPLNDPDWGAVGVVLQGDFHHKDNWFFESDEKATEKQMSKLKALVQALATTYKIGTLQMHREVPARGGKPTVCPGDHLVPRIEKMRTELRMSKR